MTGVTITREQLYEAVWSQPITRLARSYGLSDVGLAKLCKRHDVPCPPRGYWAKLQAGQTPDRIPLPSSTGSDKIVIKPTEADDESSANVAEELRSLKAGLNQGNSPIVVASDLRGAHSLVLAARNEFDQAKPDPSGILQTTKTPTLALAVSRNQLRRSLLIFDALFRALEEQGYSVDAGPQVAIVGQTVAFGITESLATVKTLPAEHDLSGRYEFGHSRYLSRKEPTGNLGVIISDAEVWFANGCRKQWRDGKSRRLEDLLSLVVSGLVEIAIRKREHAIKMEQRKAAEAEAAQKRQQTAKLRAELIAQQSAERSRVEKLLSQAESLRQSRAIRELVDAVRKAQGVEAGQLDAWAAWALMHADRLDPTKESPYCILDEKVPEDPHRW